MCLISNIIHQKRVSKRQDERGNHSGGPTESQNWAGIWSSHSSAAPTPSRGDLPEVNSDSYYHTVLCSVCCWLFFLTDLWQRPDKPELVVGVGFLSVCSAARSRWNGRSKNTSRGRPRSQLWTDIKPQFCRLVLTGMSAVNHTETSCLKDVYHQRRPSLKTTWLQNKITHCFCCWLYFYNHM